MHVEDICADKLDNSIRLGDTLFDDDDAAKQVNECVFKEPFAGEFDAPPTMDRFCECGSIVVEFVECNDVFLVVCSRCLYLIKYFWEKVRDRGRRRPRWHRC